MRRDNVGILQKNGRGKKRNNLEVLIRVRGEGKRDVEALQRGRGNKTDNLEVLIRVRGKETRR